MSYNNIKQSGLWKDTADSLNYNFNKIDSEITALNYKVSKSKGLFTTDAELKEKIPNPEEGDWAFVGTTFPAQIWIEENGSWVNSGGTGSIDVDLSGYLQSEPIGDPGAILNSNTEQISLTLLSNPGIDVFDGTDKNVTLEWNTMAGDVQMMSLGRSMSMFDIYKDGELMQSVSNYTGQIVVPVNKLGTTEFQIKASETGKIVNTVEVNYIQVLPIYAGFKTETDINNINPEQDLIKQGPRIEAIGNYILNNNTKNGYLWILVPVNMTINEIKLQNGSKIQIENPILGLANTYKFYRSTNTMEIGEYELTIK